MVMEDYNQNPQPQLQEHAIDKPLNDSRSLETEYRGSIPNSGTPGEVKEFLYSFDSLSELLENSGNTIVDVADLDMVSTDARVENDGFEVQLEKSHQNVLVSVTAEAADAQAQMQLPTESARASNELISITQYDSSEPNPTPIIKPFSAPDDDDHMPKMDQNKFSNQKTKSSRTIMKTPTSDGYNWRKYGQKQVKNTESSRSYYRCTNSDCRAKKNVRHCDHTGCIIEIVYKGQHNHDLPQKVRRSSTNRSESGSSPAVGSDSVNLLAQKLDNSESSIIKRQDSSPTSELEEHDYSDSDGDAVIRAEEENNYELKPRQRIETEEPMVLSRKGKRPRSTSSDEIFGVEAEEEHGDEQKEKQRMKGSTSTAGYSSPICKAIKESKIVVHATGDVGISSDGYRWRKYGQKMVKGSPHPRSYYRCTSAGCPVRKHVERATDDSTVTIITYEGKHDHDMPVPKKRHGPPKTALLMAAAEAINSGQFDKTETCSYQRSSTQWCLDKKSESTGENALELGGEKALESARTLLSIGIEIRPC